MVAFIADGGAIGAASSCRILPMSFLAWNSRRPVSISWNTTPSANTSARASNGRTWICSGDR